MNIGVLKLGSRISFDSLGTSGGTGETISIIKMLVRGGATVKAFSKVIKKESPTPMEGVTVYDLIGFKDKVNEMDLDALVVLNGRANYFGGQDDPYQTNNYHIINNFKGQVYYIYCDPDLTLMQVWPNVAKKEWGVNYKESDINIVREDIVYISQPYNVEKVVQEVVTGKNEVKPFAAVHYPFEKFPCLNERLEHSDYDVDLSYGGTMRGGRREKKMVKFYFDHPEDIRVEMFGKIDKDDFKKKSIADVKIFPTFSGPVNYGDMHRKMNRSLAHVVIGDPLYEEINDVPQRAYESIWAGCVTFIDSDMDKARRVYGNHEVGKFLYVSTKEELTARIRRLKETPLLRQIVLKYQIEAINFDADKYCSDFVSLFGSLNSKSKQ